MSNVVDLTAWLKTVHREVRDGAPRSVVIRRRFGTTPADLWDAITAPERVNRWFARMEGTPAVGQAFSLHDNGLPLSWACEVRECVAPERFLLTWRFTGGMEMPGPKHDDSTDLVEVRLKPDGDGTVLELEHSSEDPIDWPRGAGMGWENFLLNLGGYLEGYDVAPVFESGEVWPPLQGAWEQA